MFASLLDILSPILNSNRDLVIEREEELKQNNNYEY